MFIWLNLEVITVYIMLCFEFIKEISKEFDKIYRNIFWKII